MNVECRQRQVLAVLVSQPAHSGSEAENYWPFSFDLTAKPSCSHRHGVTCFILHSTARDDPAEMHLGSADPMSSRSRRTVMRMQVLRKSIY